MKGFRKISINKADILWAKLVRERDKKCLYCGKKEYLAAHHVFGRSRSATRLLLANGVSLCPAHHTFSPIFSAHRTEQSFRNWVRQRMGDIIYDQLEKLSNQTKSRTLAIKEFLETMSKEKKDYGPQCEHKRKMCVMCHLKPKSKKVDKSILRTQKKEDIIIE